ncbi:helix-turn-helix transcriptional regulator [Gracilibacillus oryzae]|uniref:Helix-turn-helix transcriptional regulator n=1 Tax=Gracilibacillus oryzae TaxID=1672701 RepID=A0A7C8LA19_9BACI|nr:AraC family transcriptional regulator [Gracilibacillus oryzae]KAB8139442.1 helix-turn-helix transcriptional regulator [Gracilibacillus oryzae]
MEHQIEIATNSLPLIHEVGYVRDDKGVFLHPDRVMSDLHVFIYVVSGRLKVIEEGISYDLTKGSYLFLCKNKHHWGEEFYEQGSAWFYIHFYSKDIDNKQKTFSTYRQTSIIPSKLYDTTLPLPKSGVTDQITYIESKLEQIMEIFESPHPLRPINASMEIYELFLKLYMEKRTDSYSTTNRIVTKMIDLFHKNKEKKLTSNQIEQELGMNYSYLSSLFKKHTGKSITQYQNEILIEHAIQLFKNENYNVSEVSDRLAFSNPFYFSRVFKKVTGVAPTTYLERIYRR